LHNNLEMKSLILIIPGTLSWHPRTFCCLNCRVHICLEFNLFHQWFSNCLLRRRMWSSAEKSRNDGHRNRNFNLLNDRAYLRRMFLCVVKCAILIYMSNTVYWGLNIVTGNLFLWNMWGTENSAEQYCTNYRPHAIKNF